VLLEIQPGGVEHQLDPRGSQPRRGICRAWPSPVAGREPQIVIGSVGAVELQPEGDLPMPVFNDQPLKNRLGVDHLGLGRSRVRFSRAGAAQVDALKNVIPSVRRLVPSTRPPQYSVCQ